MANALDLRNEENSDFKAALKADADAVNLITQAIEALSRFFSKNSLLAKHITVKKVKDPEYTENEDTAPEAKFSDSKSRGSENTGIVAILGMIKEDLENEKKVTDLENGMADKSKLVADTTAVYDDKDATKGATDGYLSDLKANCDWIEDQFENRKTQRKSEINGLEQAKGSLAGMKSGALVSKGSLAGMKS